MGVDDWIAREGRTCPKCGADDCRRWLTQQAAKSLLPAYVIPEWKQKEMDDDCAFTANACPTCKGKCCRDVDLGYRVEHMGAECYEHHCDDCHDGQVPAPQAQPDPRDALIAAMREAIAALPPTVFPEWAKVRAVCRRAAGLED